MLQLNDLPKVGRWFIGESLNKSDEWFVNQGYDVKNGKELTLGFYDKPNECDEEQNKQVTAKIEKIVQIRHSNIQKVYTYNLNVKYPAQNNILQWRAARVVWIGYYKNEKNSNCLINSLPKDLINHILRFVGDLKVIDSILLVLEKIRRTGELFDIFYYSWALEEVIARTYFHQIIAGVEALHNGGIIHRHLRPSTFLLDKQYNVKIGYFGFLSTVLSPMSSYFFFFFFVLICFLLDNNSGSYKAPELFLDKIGDESCDIFSIGVILFVLLTGYPPFEQATNKDRWYRALTKEKYDIDKKHEVFWKVHRLSSIGKNESVKDLIQRMLCYNPKERILISDIKKHEWYNGPILNEKELITALRDGCVKQEMLRKKDARKQADLQTSRRGYQFDYSGLRPALIPDYINERINCLHTTTDWTEVVELLDYTIGTVGGTCEFDRKLLQLKCKMGVGEKWGRENNIMTFEFNIRIFLSRIYNDDKVFKQFNVVQKQFKMEKDKKTKKEKEKEKEMKQSVVANANTNTNANILQSDSGQVEDEKIDGDAESKRRGIPIEIRRERLSVKPCYVVRVRRIIGDEMMFQNQIMKGFIFSRCGVLFTGAPKNRASKYEQTFKLNDCNQTDDNFDYDEFLKNEGFSMDTNKAMYVYD